VLGSAANAAEELRSMLEGLPGFAVTSETADFMSGVKAARECDPDVVLVIIGAEPGGALNVIEALNRQSPSISIFALSTDDRPQNIIRTMRAGATEFLALPPDRTELVKALIKATEIKRLAAPQATVQGEIWTVLAAKEGVGATTLVTNLGLELRSGLGKELVLVDLDFRAAELALFLNLNPPYSILDIALNFKRLDSVFLQGTLVRHPSGLYLLAAPPHSTQEIAGIPAEQVVSVLDLLRTTHELVLVDAPPPLTEVGVAALSRSERVIIPTELTVPSLRATWRLIELLASLDIRPPHLDVVVTKHAPKRTDITLAEARTTLKVPLNFTLPKDDDTAYQAINKGLSLADVNNASPLRKAISAFAHDLVTVNQEEEPKRKGLLRHFF
jgi:pilus assembly protein CpaE